MISLVDYGSDSGDEVDEALNEAKPSVSDPSAKATLGGLVNGDRESYLDSDDVLEDSSSISLPAVIEPTSTSNFITEADLEEMVKPKDWEIELGEKERRLRDKKAKKKAKKERRKEREECLLKLGSNEQKRILKGKAKISAFGALSMIVDGRGSDDDDESDKRADYSVKPKVSGLLAMLPTPKRRLDKNDFVGAVGTVAGFLPRTLDTNKRPITTSPKRLATSDDSDDDDNISSDFFGLSSSPEPKIPKVGDVPALVHGLADIAGPSQMEKYDADVSDYPEVVPSLENIPAQGVITDEEAHRLIMKHEIGPMGSDHRSFSSIAADIVDIRVDDALGPDVRSTLLKNLHSAARAKDAMAPLPKSKNPTDATSRRKHQITYLANLAVAREEALQQQWAESKHMKRMGRQKYGF